MKHLFIIGLLIIFMVTPFASGGEENIPSKLWVVVPGINTAGEGMLNNAEQMLRYDPDSTVIIQEAESWSDDEIKELVKVATENAIKKGKDVIVLVDMDLNHNVFSSHITPKQMAGLPIIGTKWFDAVDWAGKTINSVSISYSEAGGKGNRMVDCHSAGCDGFESSLNFAPIINSGKMKMFDEAYLSNGRTSTYELGPLLEKSGYTPTQVKLLLNKGDLPAHPHSISNLDAVKKYAGVLWTVYYASAMSGRHMDHGVLVDKLRVPGSFKVFTGKSSYSTTATVEELKLGKVGTMQEEPPMSLVSKDDDDKFFYIQPTPPLPPPFTPDKFGGAGNPPLGGVILDRENTYTVDKTGKVKELATSILKSRPQNDTTSWDISKDNKSYRVVAVPLVKTKQKSNSESELYYDDQENIVTFAQENRIIALKLVQNGSYLYIVQIAEGEKIQGTNASDNEITFEVNRVIQTDYTLFQDVANEEISPAKKFWGDFASFLRSILNLIN